LHGVGEGGADEGHRKSIADPRSCGGHCRPSASRTSVWRPAQVKEFLFFMRNREGQGAISVPPIARTEDPFEFLGEFEGKDVFAVRA
jgi:hypothetical protein